MQLAIAKCCGFKVSRDFSPLAVLHTTFTELSGTENPLWGIHWPGELREQHVTLICPCPSL